MDVDALLELIGMGPRPAKAATERTLPANPDASLMDIVRRNQQPGALPTEVNPHLRGVEARISNDQRQYQIDREAEAESIQRTADQAQRASRDLTYAETQAELERRRNQGGDHSQIDTQLFIPYADPHADTSVRGPGPLPQAPQYASLDSPGQGFTGGPAPTAPVATPRPPVPTPAPDPIDSMLAEILRGAQSPQAPTADPSAGMPQYPTPPRAVSYPLPTASSTPQSPRTARPPETPVLTPPQYPDAGAFAASMPEGPQAPIINGGAFQTIAPQNPFAESMPVGMLPASGQRPPSADVRNIEQMLRARGPISPFNEPSAIAPRPQAEGAPILTPPPGPVPTPQGPFVPQGQVIDWWANGGQRRPQPGPAPAPQSVTAQTEDRSTQLNRAELERLLAQPVSGPAPPAPSAPARPSLASVPPTPPVPVPTGATPMSPPAPPQAGESIPPALREQLLQEAYRIVGSRQQPQTLGAR